MRKLSFLFLLVFLNACSERVSSNHQLGEEREEDNSLPDFSTRLNNTLLIAGEQCSGDESTVSQGQIFNCESTEWLITVDDINICSPEGCTEVEVVPVIGILVPTSSQGDTDFFDIEASIPVDANITNTLRQVTVRFRPGETPLVLFK